MTTPQTRRLTDSEIKYLISEEMVGDAIEIVIDAQLAKTQADYQGLVDAAAKASKYLDDMAPGRGKQPGSHPSLTKLRKALRDELRNLGVED